MAGGAPEGAEAVSKKREQSRGTQPLRMTTTIGRVLLSLLLMVGYLRVKG
jgi:hypothetical protein